MRFGINWREVLRGSVRTLPQVMWLVAILLMCVLLARDRLPLVRNNYDVGHADEAAYALQARSIAKYGNTRIPYVTNFFRRYDPEIWRRDDHWPAALSWLVAPAFARYGAEAPVGRAVCIWIGTLLFPLATAGLMLAIWRRLNLWAALAAGLVLADTLVFLESTRMLTDILMATMLVGFAAGVVAARRQMAWYYLAGVFLAGAVYTKGSQVILLGLMPLGALMIGGIAALRRRDLWLGLLLGLLLLLPHWVTVWREYGNPFHSTQNHVAAFYGLNVDWDRSFYAIHWDKKPPRVFDRFEDREAWKKATRHNGEFFLRAVLLGEDTSSKRWEELGAFGRKVPEILTPHWMAPHTGRATPLRWWRMAVNGTGMVWGLLLLLLWPLWRLMRMLIVRDSERKGLEEHYESQPRPRELSGIAAFLGLLALSESLFFCLLWSGEQLRFTIFLVPLLSVLALLLPLTLWSLVAERIFERFDRLAEYGRLGGQVITVLVALAAMASAWRWHGNLSAWQGTRAGLKGYDQPFYPNYYRVAQAMREVGVGADAIVMCRNPWELLFYTPEGTRGVGLPNDKAEEIFKIARYYGVTHFLVDRGRPGLEPFLRRNKDAASLLMTRPYRLYEIDWEKMQ